MLTFDDVTDKNGEILKPGDTVHLFRYKSYWDDEYYEDPNDYEVIGYEFIQDNGTPMTFVVANVLGNKTCLSPQNTAKAMPSIPNRLRRLADDLYGSNDTTDVDVAVKLWAIANEMEAE